MKRLVVVLVAATAAVSACTTSTPGGVAPNDLVVVAPGIEQQNVTEVRDSETPIRIATALAGNEVTLRGERAENCDSRTLRSDPPAFYRTVVPVTGQVRAFFACGDKSRLVNRGDPGFALLVSELSRPNSHEPVGCLPHGQGAIRVVARTTTGLWSLSIPRDYCQHYYRGFTDLLTLLA